MQGQPRVRATVPQVGGLAFQIRAVRLDIDQVQAVLHQVKAELVSDNGRPVRWSWPAFHREASVDPQPERCHRTDPVALASGRWTAAAARVLANHSNRTASA